MDQQTNDGTTVDTSVDTTTDTEQANQTQNGTDSTTSAEETTNSDQGAAEGTDAETSAGAETEQKTDDGKSDTTAAAEQQARQQHNDQMAKQRIADRRALESAADQHVEDARKAIEAAGDDEVKRELAELKLKDAQRDARDFVREVEVSHSTMSNDYSRAMRDIDVFNPEKNPQTAQRAMDMAILNLAPYLDTETVRNPDGTTAEIILGSNVNIFEFFQNQALMFEDLVKHGSMQGQQNEARMRASAEMTGGGSTERGKAFSQMSREEKRAYLKSKGHDIN